jgi:hypothetical protein
MIKQIARNESGRFQRDDAVLRDGMIELTRIVKRVALMWELFPDMGEEERRVVGDTIYHDIDMLTDQLEQIDERKGVAHVTG